MHKINLENLKIVRLDKNNFNKNSLDNFILKQRVEKCWRKINGEYKLLPVCYTEEWNLSECQQMAQKIISEINFGSTAIAAVLNNEVVGFALLGHSLFGNEKQYVDLSEFYVTETFRRCGIGQMLFEQICFEAKQFGAKKLYISAHSAEESIAAYKKYGCVLAAEPDRVHMQKEPFDLQLEYDLVRE